MMLSRDMLGKINLELVSSVTQTAKRGGVREDWKRYRRISWSIYTHLHPGQTAPAVILIR